MLALFLADPDIVFWELKSLGPNHIGPYKLVIQHATGMVTEYFDTLTKALRRTADLENLLREAFAAAEFDDSPEPAAPVIGFDQAPLSATDKRPS